MKRGAKVTETHAPYSRPGRLVVVLIGATSVPCAFRLPLLLQQEKKSMVCQRLGLEVREGVLQGQEADRGRLTSSDSCRIDDGS
jgi:hypothetical protein